MKKILCLIILIMLVSATLTSATVATSQMILDDPDNNYNYPKGSEAPAVEFPHPFYNVSGDSFYFGPDVVIYDDVENIDLIQWYTINGGGVFDSETILYPTYTPGIIDYMQGYTNITVAVANNNDNEDFNNHNSTSVVLRYIFSANFNYEPSKPDINQTVYFYCTTTPDLLISNRIWSIKNDTETFHYEGEEINHTFISEGDWEIKLTVFDYNGTSASITKTITVTEPPENTFPIADFSYYPLNPVVGEDVFFNDDSSDPYDLIESLFWDFGDGSTSTEKNANHKYSEEGTYTVRLEIMYTIANIPESSNISKNITILPYTGTHPPYVPNTPNPENNSNNVELNSDLSWIGGDPYGFNVTYDVYFGTDKTFSLVSKNQTASNYLPNSLSYSTTYYWQIIAWNSINESSTGPVWSFTTKTSTSSGGGGTGGSTGGGGTGGGTTSESVTAIASGPYQGFVQELIMFNGSKSYSESGNDIVTWYWDFGDGNNATGEIVNYSYDEPGLYNVTLTVKDEKGNTDSDTTTAEILIPNRPPSKPEITGPRFGHRDIPYNFSIVSTDLDNDTIQYFIDWGDNSSMTVTDFFESATEVIVSHTWSFAGIYTVTIIANDGSTFSESSTFTMLIDVEYTQDIGYIIDIDGDRIYDFFYSNRTGNMTEVELQADGTYLLDETGNGEWDYIYDPITKTLTPYHKSDKGFLASINPFIVAGLLLGLMLLFFLLIVFKRKKDKEKQPQAKNK